MDPKAKHLKQLRIEFEHRLFPAAERRYGPRDEGWNIGEFIFDERGPEVVPLHVGDIKAVLFFLSPSAAEPRNYDQALFQIAHETVHLLQPANGRDAPMFEEGLAVDFSLKAPSFRDKAYRQRVAGVLSPNYRAALDVAAQGLAAIGGEEGVRRLRELRPLLRSWDEEFLMSNVEITRELAEAMCERRDMRAT